MKWLKKHFGMWNTASDWQIPTGVEGSYRFRVGYSVNLRMKTSLDNPCICVKPDVLGLVGLCIYLVDYVLPVFDEGQSASAAACVLSEVEGRGSSPQVQLSQCFSDGHLRLGTAV